MTCPKNSFTPSFIILIISNLKTVMSHFFSSQNLEFIFVLTNLVLKKEINISTYCVTLC